VGRAEGILATALDARQHRGRLLGLRDSDREHHPVPQSITGTNATVPSRAVHVVDLLDQRRIGDPGTPSLRPPTLRGLRRRRGLVRHIVGLVRNAEGFAQLPHRIAVPRDLVRLIFETSRDVKGGS